jgi:hypothetical protein
MNLKQYSTKSGLVKVTFSIIAIVGWWLGKDMQSLVAAYLFVAGLLGIVNKE